jgi:hypothetical protein
MTNINTPDASTVLALMAPHPSSLPAKICRNRLRHQQI